MKQKIFFKLDLLICSVWALFVLRFWVANLLTSFCLDEATSFPEWTLPFVTYTVLMRLSLSFMMLRREKKGLAIAVVYMLVGGACWFLLPGEVMTHALRDMYNYLTVATNYVFSPRWITSQFSPFLFFRTVGLLFPFWILVMPVAYYGIYRKKCVSTEVENRWVWSGLYLWKDALRNKYLMGCAFFLVSWCFGIVMNEWLSLIAMTTIPALAFYQINKGWGCHISIYKLLFVMVAACLLWFAQYETGNIREGILLGAALLMLIPIGIVWRKKGWLDGIWYFVSIGILLPSFCLGYDVYTVKEAKRIGNFQDEMCFTGVLIVEDDEGHIALRDRYRLIIPLFYTDVKADKLPVVKVEYEGRWKTFNTGRLGYPKGDLDLLEKRLRNRNFHNIENDASKKKTFEDCVSLARKGNVEAYMELAKRYEEGIDVEQSYANALICFMMANRLKGVMGDPLEMRFKTIHPFRLSIELLEGRYYGEEAKYKMEVLKETAPQDAKAVEAMSIITNSSEKKKALSMLNSAIKKGNEIAIVCMAFYLEDSKSAQKYERHLIAYAERFPFFYNKLGALYEKRAKKEGVNDNAMKLAIEYYKKADRHAMLDVYGASFLLNVYRKEMENGKATYNSRELYRLKLLSEQ